MLLPGVAFACTRRTCGSWWEGEKKGKDGVKLYIQRVQHLLEDTAHLHQRSTSNEEVDSTQAVVLGDNHHGITSPNQSGGKKGYLRRI